MTSKTSHVDLASILARDSSGKVIPNPPVLLDIESDPALAGTKLIAEAWDAAGLYRVGSFVGDSWREWNGRFRDDVRSFFRSEAGSLAGFVDRLIGSPYLGMLVHGILNAYWEPIEFELPPLGNGGRP